MPSYTYTCDQAHILDRMCTIAEMEEFEVRAPICQCGLLLRRVFAPRRHITFQEGYYEHISETGAYVSSMAELKRLARDNGKYSLYAEDLGGAFRAKEGRWI